MTGLLAHPAEVLPVVWVVLSLALWALLHRLGWARAAAGLAVGSPALMVALGIGVARARELTAVAQTHDVGRAQLALHVAREHAFAAQGLGWWLTWGAVALMVPAARAGLSTPSMQTAFVAAGFALASVALGAPIPLLAAVVLIGAGCLAQGRAESFIGGALAVAAAAAGVESGFTEGLVADAGWAALGAWWLVVGLGATWLLSEAVRGRPPYLWVGLAVGILAIGTGWWAAWQQARAWGPAPDLATTETVPLSLPAEAERFIGGCVWAGSPWAASTVGRVSRRHGMAACDPEAASPSARRRPTLVVEPNTAVHELVELGVGEVHLLGQAGRDNPPASMAPWRYRVLPIQILDPDARGWRPLPGAVVVARAPAALELATWLDGAPVRLDVVFLDESGLSIGDVVELCSQARASHSGGVRCAIGRGPVERWRGASVDAAP